MNERSPSLLPRGRLSHQEASYLKRQSGYERLPFLKETNLRTLSAAMYQFSASFENDLVIAHRRKKFIDLGNGEKTNPFVDVRNHVLFVEGQPGAGKSYITRHTILPFLESSAARWKETYGVDVPIAHLHWDEIENILIERDIIAPEEGKPFSKRDLEITGIVMNLLTAYKLKKTTGDFSWEDIRKNLIDPELIGPKEGEPYEQFENKIRGTFNHIIDRLRIYQEPSILVIEKPGPTALKYSLGWGTQTRHYNSRMIDDLNHVRPDSIFQGIDRSKLVIGAVGVVPGPNMNALVAYRAELQKTNSWQSADTEELNTHYGLPPFTNEKEWQAARIGANLTIMDVATNAVRTIVTQMLNGAKNQMLPQMFNYSLPTYLFEVLPSNMDLMRNTDSFFKQVEELLNDQERQQWEKLKNETDVASSYFNRPHPLMLSSSCFDLAAGAVMDINFGDVDIKTIVRNNPDINPRESITVSLVHQQ